MVSQPATSAGKLAVQRERNLPYEPRIDGHRRRPELLA